MRFFGVLIILAGLAIIAKSIGILGALGVAICLVGLSWFTSSEMDEAIKESKRGRTFN